VSAEYSQQYCVTNDKWLELALDPMRKENAVDVDVMDPNMMKKKLVVGYEDVVDDEEEL
jgi:hypothetical protein